MSRHIPDSWRHELAILKGELDALDANIAEAQAASERGRSGKLSLRHDPPPPEVHGEPVRIPDGARIAIRPIEPDDAGELRRGLQHLSALSAYRRFRRHVDGVSNEE